MKSLLCYLNRHKWRRDLGRTDYRRCIREKCYAVQKLRGYRWIKAIGMQVVKQK